MPLKIKHNKKRNTGVIYELLTRKLSESLISNDSSSAKKAVSILERYFSNNTPIGLELEAFKILESSRGCSQRVAMRTLKSIVDHVKSSIDRVSLQTRKGNLIKELNVSFGKDFFSSFSIPNYRALASMQVFLDSSVQKKQLSESVDLARIEESLLTYMTAMPSIVDTKIDPERNRFTYSLALKKYSERYGKELSESQLKLLKAYTASVFSGDTVSAKKLIGETVGSISKTISDYMILPEAKSDAVMLERLVEARVKVQALTEPNESTVKELMLYLDLKREIEGSK